MEKKLKEKLPAGKFLNVPAVRSRTMAAIRGKNNKTTELALRMALVRSRISGWRLNAVNLPGKPDLFFERKKVAVFVDGCFWHGCPRCGHVPKTRAKFWHAKIQRNKLRHIFVARQLRKKGIRVVRIWEHSLRNKSGLQNIISDMRIYHAIKASQKIGVQYEYQKTA